MYQIINIDFLILQYSRGFHLKPLNSWDNTQRFFFTRTTLFWYTKQRKKL